MELSPSSLGEMREKIRQYGTMNIVVRGDVDKGFSSMELSSSLFRETGEKGSAVWNYHHHH